MENITRDTLILIALNLDIPELLHLCNINSKFNKLLCKNNTFWMNKLHNDYPETIGFNFNTEDYKSLYFLKKSFDIIYFNGKIISDEPLLYELVFSLNKIDKLLKPSELYELLLKDITWYSILDYLMIVDYMKEIKLIIDNKPTIPLYLFTKYLIGGLKYYNESLHVLSNINHYNVIYTKDKDKNKYTVDILYEIHGENFGSYPDDDPRWELVKNFIINWENYNVLKYHFINVNRVLPGIAQDEIYATWGPHYTNKEFYGNTILLDLGNQTYRYLQGDVIFDFIIPEGEYISEYYSFLHNNTVPIPIALSQNYIYFVDDQKYLSRNMYPVNTDWRNFALNYDYTIQGEKLNIINRLEIDDA